MLSRIKQFVKKFLQPLSTFLQKIVKNHKSDIILIIIVILVSLLSFGIGFCVAKYQQKQPLEFKGFSYEKNSLSYSFIS